jgi:hypothetical protein
VYCNYYRSLDLYFQLVHASFTFVRILDSNLHSPARRLIELQMEHAELNASIDALCLPAAELPPAPQSDELQIRRLKKRRLALRDQIAQLRSELDGKEPA